MNPVYVPLRDAESEGRPFLPDGDETHRKSEQLPGPGNNRFLYAGLVVTVLCTIYNLSQVVVQHSPGLGSTTEPLRRPSTYIGLYAASPSSEDWFSNFPLLLTQIDRAQKSQIAKDGVSQSLARIGTVWPDLRRFVLKDSLSSIAQFRTVDYGYERCALAFALDTSKQTANRTSLLPASTFSLDFWLHPDVPRLAGGTLSYESFHKQSKSRKFMEPMQLTSGVGRVESKWFACPPDRFITVEIACNSDTVQKGLCNVEFWDDPKHPLFGLTLTQKLGFADGASGAGA